MDTTSGSILFLAISVTIGVIASVIKTTKSVKCGKTCFSWEKEADTSGNDMSALEELIDQSIKALTQARGKTPRVRKALQGINENNNNNEAV
jgi:hypothetical protein